MKTDELKSDKQCRVYLSEYPLKQTGRYLGVLVYSLDDRISFEGNVSQCRVLR